MKRQTIQGVPDETRNIQGGQTLGMTNAGGRGQTPKPQTQAVSQPSTPPPPPPKKKD